MTWWYRAQSVWLLLGLQAALLGCGSLSCSWLLEFQLSCWLSGKKEAEKVEWVHMGMSWLLQIPWCSSHIPLGSPFQPALQIPCTLWAPCTSQTGASLCLAGVTEDHPPQTRKTSQWRGVNSSRMIPTNEEWEAQPACPPVRQSWGTFYTAPQRVLYGTEAFVPAFFTSFSSFLFPLSPALPFPAITSRVNHLKYPIPCLRIFFWNQIRSACV